MQNFDEYLHNKDEIVREILEKLFSELDDITIGDYKVEKKQESLHIVKNTAFLGVHFLKSALRLNIVLNHSLETSLKVRVDQPSANVYHNKVDLEKLEDLDDSLLGHIKEAYEIKS